MCSCGFGEQLTGKLIEIFVDFLQSVNFIFKFGNSHFCVFTITKDRLEAEETHGYKRLWRRNHEASARLTLSVTAFISEFSRSAFRRYDSSSCCRKTFQNHWSLSSTFFIYAASVEIEAF